MAPRILLWKCQHFFLIRVGDIYTETGVHSWLKTWRKKEKQRWKWGELRGKNEQDKTTDGRRQEHQAQTVLILDK